MGGGGDHLAAQAKPGFLSTSFQKIIQKQSHRFLPRYQAPTFPPSSDRLKPSSVEALAELGFFFRLQSNFAHSKCWLENKT